MPRFVTVLLPLLLVSCAPEAPDSIYYWKTTLNWTAADSAALKAGGIERLGLRLFDWGDRGEVGSLAVRSPIPEEWAVVPVVYVTTARLEAWALPGLDAPAEAGRLFYRMEAALARAWPGRPEVWQLDADWTARTRDSWFAVAAAFRDLVHARGARFEVTVRLHQYRDRDEQGIPPADAGVLMLYGLGDAVLDQALIQGYLRGPAYPIPLTPAFPWYTQVRQLNGYGRLVALHRLGPEASLPLTDLKALEPDRYEVVRRSSLAGRPLLARDVLAIDRVDPEILRRVAALPAVEGLRNAAGGRLWWFDYEPGSPVPRLP